MEILTLINQPYPNMIGGTAVKLLGESKYLLKNGHNNIVISSRGGKKPYRLIGDEYGKIHHVGLPYVSLGKSKHIFLFLKMIIWLIVNSSYFMMSFFKSLKYMNKIDVISIKGIYGDGLCGVLLKKIYKKRLVYEHAGGLNMKRKKLFKKLNRGKYFTKIALYFNKTLETFVYKHCDAIMTQDNMESYYRDLGFKGDYHIVKNGTDPEIFYPRNESELKKEYNIDGKVILFVGRLTGVKNIDKIIESLKYIKNSVSLVIVGDGELKEELYEKAKISGKDIHFMGAHIDPSPFYNIADVVVIASDYEGLPGLLIETLASEKVIVSSPVGVIPEIILHGINGYLLPIKWTINDLSRTIKLGLNAPESVRIKAKRTFDQKYSWDIVIKKFIEVYKS